VVCLSDYDREASINEEAGPLGAVTPCGGGGNCVSVWTTARASAQTPDENTAFSRWMCMCPSLGGDGEGGLG
jgi:hypothetical protein